MAHYVKNPKNRETLFYAHATVENPDKNAYSMHSHNVYEVIYIIKGDVSYTIEDRTYKLSPGDLVISRPSDLHSINIDSPALYDRQNILFDGKEAGLDMSILPKGLDVISVPDGSTIRGIFEKIDYYAEMFEKDRFFDILNMLTREIIYNLSVWQPDIDRISAPNPVLSAALKYIKDHLFEIRDVEEIAQAVFVTESYLFRLFKKHLRQSPKKYIRGKRMLKAQRMLWEGKLPLDVAARCGFSDYATFYRNYIDFFGTSPSDKNFDFQLTKTVD